MQDWSPSSRSHRWVDYAASGRWWCLLRKLGAGGTDIGRSWIDDHQWWVWRKRWYHEPESLPKSFVTRYDPAASSIRDSVANFTMIWQVLILKWGPLGLSNSADAWTPGFTTLVCRCVESTETPFKSPRSCPYLSNIMPDIYNFLLLAVWFVMLKCKYINAKLNELTCQLTFTAYTDRSIKFVSEAKSLTQLPPDHKTLLFFSGKPLVLTGRVTVPRQEPIVKKKEKQESQESMENQAMQWIRKKRPSKLWSWESKEPPAQVDEAFSSPNKTKGFLRVQLHLKDRCWEEVNLSA